MKKLLSLVMALIMALCLSGCTKSIQEAKVGDVVEFGQYVGKKLRWIVLDTEISGEKLLLSENGVNIISYHSRQERTYHWYMCTLRKWLNDDFFDTFTKEEKSKIKTKPIENGWKDRDGNLMYDKLFCLSKMQIAKYKKMGVDFSKCKYMYSDYAKNEAETKKELLESFGEKELAQEVYDRMIKMNFAWWLSDACDIEDDASYARVTGNVLLDAVIREQNRRNYGIEEGKVFYAFAVDYKGEVKKIPQFLPYGDVLDTYLMVRPAMWVKCE